MSSVDGRATPIGATTVAEVFDHVLAVEPQRTALIGPSGSLTYAEFDAAANAAASAFRGMGVSVGDRVAACLPNDLDIAVAFHGAMRLGAIWVGINRNLAPPEKSALVAAATPTMVLTDPVSAPTLERDCRVVRADREDQGCEWSAALARGHDAQRPAPPDPDAPAAIAFTSGTTGLPKGVVHSQRNLLLQAASLAASRQYDATLRKGDCLPMTILNLQVLTTLLTAAAGGCCLLTERRDARGVAEWIERESVTVWNGVPALLYSMVYDLDLPTEQLASLKEVWSGGAPCPEDLRSAFCDRFGLPLFQAYGLTEAPAVVTIEPLDRPHVRDSSGVPLPHLEVDVWDDEGKPLVRGQTGEIVVHAAEGGPWAGAYTPMLGYWRSDHLEPSGESHLQTGDIGVVDEDGNLFVRDRKSLLILRGGANVYPAEVERVLEHFPGVRASAVVGLPDPRLGQRVVAAIEVDGRAGVAPSDVIEHCRSHLARYKVPEEIVVVDAFARNAMGKVDRRELTGLFEHRHLPPR